MQRRVYGLTALLMAAGCNIIAINKDFRPQIATATGYASLNIDGEAVDDECERCEGKGYYYIRDTGVKKECEVCNGTGTFGAGINFIPLDIARTNNKPTWVHFKGKNCSACKKLEPLFETEDFKKLTEGINCVLIQVPSDQSIIWGVRSTPTDIFVNERWKIIGRVQPPESKEYMKYFTQKLKEFKMINTP